jgi:putative cell wall-binding protein
MRRIFFLPALLVCALVVSLAPLAAAQEAEGPTPTGDHDQVVDITFPTDPAATFTDDYATQRSRGEHGATDLMGEKMWPVYAAVGGTVTFIPGAEEGESKPHYGYMIRIQGDDGRRYSYVHLNDDTPGTSDASAGPEHAYAPGLRRGSVVERGQFIGWMGDSGNAKGGTPHLHFEIADDDVVDPQGTDRINPYNSLKDALRRGDVASGDDVPASSSVDRISGLERVATAVALSRSAFDRADTVVVTYAGSFPDSIVAGPLAAALDAPVLTTYGEELEDRVIDEVRRLGATEAYLVGPTSRLSTAIGDALIERTDVTREGLSRLAGPDDFSTAATVAKKVRGLTGSAEALVALSSHPDERRAWPDALSAGYHGAVTGHPVLLVAHDDVPQVTIDALADLDRATIIGGTAAVSAESEAAIAEVVENVRRLAGPDRFTTSSVVVDDLLDQGLVEARRLWAATGHAYADALAAASAVAASGEALLMIDGFGENGDAGLGDWFSRRSSAIKTGRVIGGEAAVNGQAVDRLAQRIR